MHDQPRRAARRAPPTVGIRYLAELTDNPGTPISSVALVSNHGDAGPTPRREPVLDDMAKARYRARIGELLAAEIDDADLCADLERARVEHASSWTS